MNLDSAQASNSESGGYETVKNSKSVYKKWVDTMDPKHLRSVTESCEELLKTLHYELSPTSS